MNFDDFTTFQSAFIVRDGDAELGRIWFDEETKWNTYINELDSGYDFVDSFEDAIQNVLDEAAMAA